MAVILLNGVDLEMGKGHTRIWIASKSSKGK